MNRVKKICRRHTSFTLVELLVVIAIIAILASVVLAGASAAIRSAQKQKMKVVATNIQTGVLNYYTEYGVYPVISGTTTDTKVSSATDWGPVMVALCGNADPGTGIISTNNTISNTRQIAFLSPNRSDLDTSVTPAVLKTILKPTSLGAANQYYQMALDSDYNNILGGTTSSVIIPDMSGTTVSTSPGVALSAGVGVWSNCDQNATGGTGSKSTSWISTW